MVEHWLCDGCGNDFDTEWEAEECCGGTFDDSKVKEDG